ncbi:hypothetical protein [Agromyces mariniharenae]|uniref:Uncharacterized protein n=1 Tax=Agromyces mariniharenae TaxID=2604423 RepID=A0A5S4V608_9MICO|nr:hypothetical protein [Agromyces mariniharenae]TYL53578.1 hypothetical protein FYC51_07935 [Agromyces mariniharenae]
MAVIAPPRQPDSRDAESTVEPDRGGEALIEEAKQHAKLRRRRVAVTAVVASLAVVLATGLAFGFAGATSERGPEPAVTKAELVPAYPVASAELVASFYTHWGTGLGDNFKYVYDDGRVVSTNGAGGWQQQRLTPGGLELLRAGITASGILGPDRYVGPLQGIGSGAFVQLRVDGVLTAAWQPWPAVDEIDAFNQVIGQLIRFGDWLPADAWAQRETTAYVPPGYAVCAEVMRADRGVFATTADRDAALAHLPEDAAAVLAAGPRFLTFDAQVDAYIASGSTPSSDVIGCRHLTPAQAQSVVDALVTAWPGWGRRVLLAERETNLVMSTRIPGVGRVGVTFGPMLPHGVPEFAMYG